MRLDLKTGTDCNSNCVFCVIGDKLFTGDRSFEDCCEEMRLARATSDDIVFTGAEVTIRPDFLQLVAAARRLGYRNIQIQTNGRRFAYLDFCKAAVAAGANEFSPSIHGPVARLHDGLTRSPGFSRPGVTTACDRSRMRRIEGSRSNISRASNFMTSPRVRAVRGQASAVRRR